LLETYCTAELESAWLPVATSENFLEKLLDDHLSGGVDQALSHARDGSSYLDVTFVTYLGGFALWDFSSRPNIMANRKHPTSAPAAILETVGTTGAEPPKPVIWDQRFFGRD
jgi:hypothetical protein